MSIRTMSQNKLSANIYNKTKAIPAGGSALFTAANSSYLNVGNQAGLKLGSGDFTVEAWMKRTTTAAYVGVAGDYTGGSTASTFCWFSDYGGTLPCWYVNSSFVLAGSTAVALNTWTHVAWVRSSGTLKLYINGTLDGSASNTTDYTNSASFWIGQVPLGGTANYYNGYLSNFRVVKSAVYSSNFTPSKNLTAIANTALLTARDSALPITDKSSNAYTITNNGSVTASADIPT